MQRRQNLFKVGLTRLSVSGSQSEFVKTLREQRDRRVWVAEGSMLGTFAGFVGHALPDLREEEIRKKVLATHRALAKASAVDGGVRDGE